MPDLGNVPEWGAIVVALVAGVYAAWSRHEAKRSANAAEESLRHQQAPQFTAEVENPGGDSEGRHGTHQLTVRLIASSAGPIDRLQADMLTEGVAFPRWQNGVEATIRPPEAGWDAGGYHKFRAVHAYEDTTQPASRSAIAPRGGSSSRTKTKACRSWKRSRSG